MLTLKNNIVPVKDTNTFGDLALGSVFCRVRVKGFKTGTKPHTIYRKNQNGSGGTVANIAGAMNGQALHNGDVIGQASAYIKDTTEVRLLGQDCSLFDCEC